MPLSLVSCPNRTIFDVETKYIDDPYLVPITTIQIITTKPYKEYIFYEDNVREAVDILLASEGYVTFNGRRFDVPVMLKYMNRGEGRVFKNKPHFDIFHELRVQKPWLRISLNNFAKTTLDDTKVEGPDGPIRLWRVNPRLLDIYGLQDARITYQLYVYYCSFGKLWYTFPKRTFYVPNTISRPSV